MTRQSATLYDAVVIDTHHHAFAETREACGSECPGGNDELGVTRIHRFASCDASPSLVGGAGEGEAVGGAGELCGKSLPFLQL